MLVIYFSYNIILKKDETFSILLSVFIKPLRSNIFYLVEVNGIEPMTSCVQSRRSPSWATPPKNASLNVVGQGGLEPPTSRLSSARSNQLSY